MEAFLKDLQQRVIDAGVDRLSISIHPKFVFISAGMGLESEVMALTIPEAAEAIEKVRKPLREVG